MNIKKSDLIKIIESVVRECITERNKRQLAEAGLTSEKADGKVTPLDDIVRDVIKSGVKGRENIIKRAKELYKLQVSKQPVEDDSLNSALADAGVTEASYKVVSPRQAADAKEVKARQIQTEPEVNETAYKVQGPAAKTFKDSPQFPEAVNDPKNR